MTAPTKSPLAAEPVVDGRRLRSEVSRLRIVEAMIALVSEGLTMPPAEAVAARAGVGLRTVFRLFEDMDGLYRGMQAVMTERLGGLLEGAIEASDWHEAINILIDRRAEAFEMMLPLQMAADSVRTRSAALRDGRLRLVRGQRDTLLAAGGRRQLLAQLADEHVDDLQLGLVHAAVEMVEEHLLREGTTLTKA
eukprot:gene5433-7364_t